MHRDPALARRALNTIADVVADLLLAQVDAGADAVQLFDSWASPAVSTNTAISRRRPQRITAKLNARKVPTLLFVRGGMTSCRCWATVASPVSAWTGAPSGEYARKLYPNHILQGNIDPVLLLGSPDVIRQRTRALLETMKYILQGQVSILNLGHGILPGTPPETVAALVVNSFGVRLGKP